MAMPELKAGSGVVVTIGIMAAGDRTAIVIPLATPTEEIDNKDLCFKACDAVESSLYGYLLDCICTQAYIRYIQAEAMMNGKVPFRKGYGTTEYPGTRTGVVMPSNVAGLALFYSYKEEDDPPTKRTRVAKTFLPGLSATDVDGDVMVSALRGKITLFANALIDGIADSGSPSNIWHRALAVPRPRPTDPQTALGRIASAVVPNNVATQRRRLIPSFT